ncbi:hypothetical protein C2R22_14955 [Salinigranum rubrum]|uniref:Uncharacterized protein n=1 Tax=Salinigranum rubrum TaxID=755307 RepID=A0A2I8VLI9_9EURY|nr:hypothetical protein [Salinigranum rubrum]AUV82781.1 hypothetical protein C2R22_14955 [Salinigranum rubrum]
MPVEEEDADVALVTGADTGPPPHAGARADPLRLQLSLADEPVESLVRAPSPETESVGDVRRRERFVDAEEHLQRLS